jgi:hypothetical protein
LWQVQHVPLFLCRSQSKEQAHTLQEVLLRGPQEIVSPGGLLLCCLERDDLLVGTVCLSRVLPLDTLLRHFHNGFELFVSDLFVATV